VKDKKEWNFVAYLFGCLRWLTGLQRLIMSNEGQVYRSKNEILTRSTNDLTLIAEPQSSTPLIPKHATGHDSEPFLSS